MDNVLGFVVKADNTGLLRCFLKKKGWFNKIKTSEVALRDLFLYPRETAKTGSYIAIPKIEGMNKEEFLFKKAKFYAKEKTSDFNFRTIWKFNCKEHLVEEFEVDGEPIYRGILKGSMQITCEDDNGVLANDFEYAFPYIQTFKLTPRMVELLHQNACNGIYQSARDVEDLNKELQKINGYEDAPTWVCEECNEKFVTLDDFYCHLIEEKHYDSIFESHPFDKECLRVKNLSQKK